MAKRKPDLQKIVSLKRQKAEQDVRQAQIELDAAGSEGKRLSDSLAAMDVPHTDVHSRVLSQKYGHVSKLIHDADVNSQAVSEKETRLRDARDVLKRAFDSEDRLKRMKK